jgi:arylsulfatase A-like enzyme
VLLLTIDTLRPDHLSAYGYRRPTSPRIDALAREGVLFEQAFTFWPKTRGSFVALFTGKPPSRSGYGKSHPVLIDWNPTLASVLQGAGYRTAALVDNPNVAAGLGYAKGFSSYVETWEDASLPDETARTRRITEGGVAFLRAVKPGERFFLWLHYVNPHTPYTPPPPFDTRFMDDAETGPRLPVVGGLHGGIPKPWAVAGRDRLAYYVAQYDGEIAAVDVEVGTVVDALRSSAARDDTIVVLTSDHGESLGEHDYYFDHGENLFDPTLRIPLVVAGPGVVKGARSEALVSTLDLLPTVLDAVKISYPADLAGRSVWPAAEGRTLEEVPRLFAQNDRNLAAAFDRRYKIVGTPEADRIRFSLFDRSLDPKESKDVSAAEPEPLREQRREIELYLERSDREWARLRPRLEGQPGERAMTPEACERLRALGYANEGCR